MLRHLRSTIFAVLLAASVAGNAQLIQPGDVLISNHTGNNVQLLRPSTGSITSLVTVPGTPIGLALDTNGKLYINVNDGIEKFDPTTGTLAPFFTGNGQREGLAFDRDSGLLFSISFGSNLIEVVNLNGVLVRTMSIPGTTDVLGVTARSGTLVITDFGTGGVYVGTTTGTAFTNIGIIAPENTYAPAIDIAGNIFVNDFLNDRVVQFTPQPGGGYVQSTFISGLSNPDNGLSIGPDGSFTISEFTANRVSIYNNDGTLRQQFPGVQSPDELVVFNPPCANAGGDSDGDGLCDDWEKNGLTVNINGNPVFIDLPAMGADPKHKDIFIQTDYMVDPGLCLPLLGCFFGHSHKPKLDAMALVTQAFANAPVDNPDGTTGITVHIDCGPDCIMNPKTGETWGTLSLANALAHQTDLGTTVGSNYDWTAFDQLKTQNFLPARQPVFHYVIFAHNLGGLDGTSGISRGITASDFIVSLGSWDNQIGTILQQGGTLMHELGHNLSLRHGGADDVNHKPNYLSVMNYFFQTGGVIINGTQGTLDYSRFLLPNMDENHLNENIGLNGGAPIATYGTMYFCPGAGSSSFITNANNAIDWNCNGSIENDIAADVNHEGGLTVLSSFNDWPHLVFNGGAIGELGLASQLPTQTPGQDEVTPSIDAQTSKPLKVTVASPGITQRPAGSSVDLVFTVSNSGTQGDKYDLTAKSNVAWANLATLPASVSLDAGASAPITIHANVPVNTPVGTAGSFSLKATSVSSPKIQDSGEAIVTSLAPICSPPSINSASATPSSLWPPDHKMIPVTVSTSTSNGCGSVSCKIISVTSNEPVNPDGDWVITGNLTLTLRAERLGSGTGRIYTIVVQCTDDAGNSVTKNIIVTVPHDQRP
ncbi:MAG TPA: hypothetical protein VFR24_08790 [Candidatus Angelobacter sp.]|nr:hypothetical protein [Candidatus Angelobacter sp.]